MTDESALAIATRAIHAAERRLEGAVTFPIFQTSMFKSTGETNYDDVRYIRLNNLPNQAVLGEKLAELEGTEAALVFSSGMAAIVTSLLAHLASGDHMIAHRRLYGGTLEFVEQNLPRYGIGVDLVNARRPEEWDDVLRPETRLFYVEAITNPLNEVADFGKVIRFCRQHGLVSVIDSTFATPCNFRPAEVGFDVVVHSGSKYLGGHSDLVAGAAAGSAATVERIKHLSNQLGGCLDPHACFLLHRSLKTLPLRMERHNRNAMAIACYLQTHPDVARVHYPGLATHPDHTAAKAQFDGFGGMIAMEMAGGGRVASRVVENTRLFVQAPSLGGIESLISRPAATSHLGLTPEQLTAAGIDEGLIRLSVGIEAADDLIADLEQAIESAG